MNSPQWASVFNAWLAGRLSGQIISRKTLIFSTIDKNLEACVLRQFGQQIASRSIRHFSKLTDLPYMLRVRLRSGM
jgi:hypothetical protein